MGKWTVTPSTSKVDGEFRGESFWVELKDRLTAGEDLKMRLAGFRSYSRPGEDKKKRQAGDDDDDSVGTQLQVDFARTALARILTYVVEWSLEEDGKRLRCNRQTVESLDPAFIDTLNDIINEHEERRGDEKKVPSGETEQPALSD